MTRERAKELLPVIQAYADGKSIEWILNGVHDDKFTPCPDPTWSDGREYRIKPEPREFTIRNCDNQDHIRILSGASQLVLLCARCRTIHVREVLE